MLRPLRQSHGHQLAHVEMAVLHRYAGVAILQVLTHPTPSINREGGEMVSGGFDHIQTACILFDFLSRNGAPEEVSSLGTTDKNAISPREERCIHRERKRLVTDEHLSGVDWILIEVTSQRLGAPLAVFFQLCICLLALRIRMVELLHLLRHTLALVLTKKLMTAIQTFVKLPPSLPAILFQTKRLTFLALFLGILNLGKDIALRLAEKAVI